jgi:hypothetical protein
MNRCESPRGHDCRSTIVLAMLFAALHVAAPSAHAQEQLWVTSIGAAGHDGAFAAAPDGVGGTFVAGSTDGSLGGPNSGDFDVFLARYDSAGGQTWIVQFGTTGPDQAFAAAPDGAGGVFLAGNTLGSLGGPTAGGTDLYLARYDALGNKIWMRQFGTNDFEEAVALTPDGTGGVFVAGSTHGVLGGASAGIWDAFVARYDSAGNRVWIRQFGSIRVDQALALASDGTGGVMVAGKTNGDMVGTNKGEYDVFLARFDGGGNRLWLKQFGSDKFEQAAALAPDGAGGVIVAGWTRGNLGGTVAGVSDVFLASYDGAGNRTAIRQFGTSGPDEAAALVPDGHGGLYLAGTTGGNLGGPLFGLANPFVMNLDGAGNQNWVRQFAIIGFDTAHALASDGLGGAVVAGRTSDFVTSDAFLARYTPDTDGDGLFDDWETNGVPYISGAGLPARYLLPGADPLHKDLFLEVDTMSGLTLSAFAITAVEAAFANAPLTNPDGVDGVTLHVTVDESTLPLVTPWLTDGCWPLDFDSVRLRWYGTAAERAVSDPAALLAAKAKAYRYGILADKSGPKSIGGCGQTPGDNIVMYSGNYNEFSQASVLMHELGHNLNLKHGGGDDVNGKPNYPSVMNYVLAYPATWSQNFWRLDYSRAPAGTLGVLDEASLVERAGIGDWSTRGGFYGNFFMPFGVNVKDTNGNTVRSFAYVKLDGSLTDFGDIAGTMFQDGNKRSVNVVQDLNFAASGPSVPKGIPNSPTPGNKLKPYDDWANVGLPLSAALGTGAPVVSYPTDELTVEAVAWMNANFTVPTLPCYADCDLSTGVGVLDIFDFLCFQNDFVTAASYACDCDTSTGQGVCDIFDFLCFQSAFVGGCP